MNTNKKDYNEEGKSEYESPLLTKLKQTPIDFKEPEGYFDEFNRKLNERIKYEQPSLTPLKKKGIIRKLYNPYYAVAATLLVAISVIGLNHIIEAPLKPPTQAEIADVVSTEKIETIDEEVLIEVLDTEVIEETEILNEEEISDEIIIDYLVENNIDLDLINEL
ncbi:MAG: hypothetical protein POELPBGB_00413 [Bacteroidia bacterium]|nr:hypothetical protein [Bacteroidia bacterium]